MSDDDDPSPKKVRIHHHSRVDRRHVGYGRRNTDPPQVTLSKKLLVILLAVVNVAYLAGEALLSATNVCGH